MALFIPGEHGTTHKAGALLVTRPSHFPQGTVLVECHLPVEVIGFPFKVFLSREEALKLITDLATELSVASPNQH